MLPFLLDALDMRRLNLSAVFWAWSQGQVIAGSTSSLNKSTKISLEPCVNHHGSMARKLENFPKNLIAKGRQDSSFV